MIAFKKWTGLLNAASGEVPMDSEMRWLTLAQKGDRLAFQKLLELHYDTIYQVAYRFTGHSEDAEDITQDVCVGLANKIHAYRGEAKFKTWLYTIIVNACLDGHRKRNRQYAQLVDYLEFEAHDRAVNHDKAQQIASLYRELARLKEPFKETAFLVLAQDLSHAEVGQILGCSESTISWRMHEIRHKLKALMENDHEG
ncbi:MAG: RNA polymerase sigma factor [Methylococcaceae bacterium]|nr:RNA polymerase sigma factor [Methylococcaceae bacterium]MDD1617462.1 RNA polymerase sigma factor [Methylococcaceae bacterium]OYV15501.1 MAG: RNA polymerase sigma-70 factor, ECF subfamily [Methylococcaceae bacterium NSP1-2]